jgi:hypothetical protein
VDYPNLKGSSTKMIGTAFFIYRVVLQYGQTANVESNWLPQLRQNTIPCTRGASLLTAAATCNLAARSFALLL